MTPAQLAAVGIPQPKCPPKKPSKDQQIAALEEDLCMARELLQMNNVAGMAGSTGTAPGSPDIAGDTEPASDNNNNNYFTAASSHKRQPQKLAGGVRMKQSGAINPFETEKIHSRTTGLINNWRHKLPPTPSPSNQTFTVHSSTATPHSSTTTPRGSTITLRSVSGTPPPPPPNHNLVFTTPIDEDPIPIYSLPRMVNQQRVDPGIKDLPPHIRADFHNTFIHVVIQSSFNTEQPWNNPSLPMLQATYNKIYPEYPAHLHACNAVFHPTVTAVCIVRSCIGTAAVFAVQRHLGNAFHQRRLQTIDARAKFVSEQFMSNDNHPFIWCQYVAGDIPNHPGIGGYQTIHHGVSQPDPILETLLIYYSSSGIMETPPIEDPGEGNHPIGTLALVTAMVECAYRMHSTSDYIEATQGFNAKFWNEHTALFMEYITKDLTKQHWNSIFAGLAAVSKRVAAEVAAEAGAPPAP